MKLDLSFSESGGQFSANFGETSVIHDGQNGATFIPSVSAEGVISWTNDRELPNPAPVNIKGGKGDKGDKGERGERGLQGIQGIQGERGEDGAKGDKGDRGEQGIQGIQGIKGDKGDTGANGKNGVDGYTPVKGKDYFTDSDVQEIAEQAAGLVEIPEGGISDWNDLENRPFYDNEDGTVAKQLDNKYLSILEITHSVDVLPEQDVTFVTPSDRSTPSASTNLSIDSLSLNIGEDYNVEIDGVVYKCTANTTYLVWEQYIKAEYLGSPLPGYGENAMPFVVACGEERGGVTIFYSGDGTFVKRVRIYQGEDSCKIKPEYLPLYNGEVESV